jgi:prepilin-type N-terminal cleavage/methylation domain-containing protein
MQNLTTIKSENGFTLIESIITVTLVALMCSGLFLAWQLMGKRDRNYEQYWQYKDNLELAYQITHQTLRANAKLATAAIINSGQGILFIGTDNLLWTFTMVGSDYTLTHNGKEEILIHNICNHASFVLNGNQVDITLGVINPPGWTGMHDVNIINDLNINGRVYIRNP